jgi:hypothetical protein
MFQPYYISKPVLTICKSDTAGTAVGSGFGLATAANIIAVKVCSDTGSCAVSDVVAGINFAVSRAASSGRPSSELLDYFMQEFC